MAQAIYISDDFSAKQLKMTIANITGMPLHFFRVSYKGRPMDGNRPLAEFKIMNRDTVEVTCLELLQYYSVEEELKLNIEAPDGETRPIKVKWGDDIATMRAEVIKVFEVDDDFVYLNVGGSNLVDGFTPMRYPEVWDGATLQFKKFPKKKTSPKQLAKELHQAFAIADLLAVKTERAMEEAKANFGLAEAQTEVNGGGSTSGDPSWHFPHMSGSSSSCSAHMHAGDPEWSESDSRRKRVCIR